MMAAETGTLKETGTPLYVDKLERYGDVKELPPSSILRLLQTNGAPLDTQRDEVRSLLVEPKAELAAVENDIDDLQARLADCQRRKRELISYVEDLGALLSPIRRMPPEIMARIFEFCGDIGARGPHAEPSKRAPLLLGSVCRSWRALSLAIPRLWTTLYLRLPTSGPFVKQQEILQAWLERSRPFPISLWLWNDFLTDDIPVSFLRKLTETLAENSDRWKAIFIHFPAYDPDWEYFDALVRCHFPNLEELEISPQFTPWAPFNPEQMPRLRELQVPAGAMPDSHRTLPWTQLTHLTLRGGYRTTDVSELLQILSCAPLLSYLHVEISQYRAEGKWDDTQDRITMPCLNTLVLVTITNHEECINHFTDALVLPHLRDFQLLTRVWDRSNMTTPWCHDSFMGLLSRSKCSINHFTLHAININGAQLRQVVERCPSLVLLKLHGSRTHIVLSEIIKDMVYDSSSQTLSSPTSPSSNSQQDRAGAPLAPWLKALSLSCESVDALTYKVDDSGLTFEEAFSRMVKSRTVLRTRDSKVLQLKWIHWTIWWEWYRACGVSPVKSHPDPALEQRLSELCAGEVDVGVSAATYNKYKRVS